MKDLEPWTIWKFPLEVTDVQSVEVPVGARPLFVAVQHGTLTLWAHVAPQRRKEPWIVAIVGTGNPAPEPFSSQYVGSALMDPFVWHVFIRREGS